MMLYPCIILKYPLVTTTILLAGFDMKSNCHTKPDDLHFAIYHVFWIGLERLELLADGGRDGQDQEGGPHHPRPPGTSRHNLFCHSSLAHVRSLAFNIQGALFSTSLRKPGSHVSLRESTMKDI